MTISVQQSGDCTSTASRRTLSSASSRRYGGRARPGRYRTPEDAQQDGHPENDPDAPGIEGAHHNQDGEQGEHHHHLGDA
ncbi:MAG: hypothetical protein QXS54_07410, partial [Candidatus Methanomethylicaceae archaeon]